MSHVLSIQDLSCVGRCSLTVALPVYGAMGIRCSVLPTVVLSTHTAFPKPEAVSLREQMVPFARHWKENGIAFDGISLGYLSNPAEGEAAMQVLDMQENDPLILVDPVMGDGGKLYSRITPAHIETMRRLCARADMIVPNLTEAAYLTGLPYRETDDRGYLGELLAALLDMAENAVITGVPYGTDMLGVFGGGRGTSPFDLKKSRIPRSCHGTGDLFAAVITGCLMEGRTIPCAAGTAMDFVCRCVENTPDPTPHGVEFESQLPWLMKRTVN